MSIKRNVLKFLIPINIMGVKSNTVSNRRVIPCYISPQDLKIDEKKIINQTFTKGGYIVEYWGEELPSLSASGTTGSGGIEVINILRSIYRNEQIQMANILRARDAEARELSSGEQTGTRTAGFISALDSLSGDGFSEILSGTSSIIDEITDIYNEAVASVATPVTFIPSLGAFAVSVDLYMQGVKYRGYFTDFRTTENAESIGLFDYSFTFKVLRISGKRKNSMPWHRNPYDQGGNPKSASIPIEGARLDELSYQTNATGNINENTNGFSTFIDDRNISEIPDVNDVGVSRFKKAQS